ncbi:hypothetical protein FA15DRAFT_666930 [Coprinopsis marcescibilis]|uniref:Uncharacterized protein n=1 Tax=Coprinopsis marcescibilis TaxID=230819 RepID=A0A5C3L2K9_COPMA|nr:hypothetical protein FA15DRAFT_666930 [Coprinopsis marcescibilis]
MASPKAVYLIHDNTSPGFEFAGFTDRDISISEAPQPEHGIPSTAFFYGNTVLQSFEPIGRRSFTFQFDGTSVALFGRLRRLFTPIDDNSVRLDDNVPLAEWRIDEREPQNFTLSTDVVRGIRRNGQWFTSPTLPDGAHTVSFDFFEHPTHPPNLFLDFAVTTSGNLERYDEETRIVVDDNIVSEISYSGGWEQRTLGLDIDLNFLERPFHNGTHRTSTVGDNFSFRFSGSSISIYGCQSRAAAGSLDVTYTIDNLTPEVRSLRVPQFLVQAPGEESIPEKPNWLLYERTGLEPGEHVITANLTHIENQIWIVDYLVYAPSFPDLASKPTLTVSGTPPSSAFTIPPNDSTVGSSVGGQGKQVSVIVGGIIGALAFVAVLALLATYIIRKRRKSNSYNQPDLGAQVLSLPVTIPTLITTGSYTGTYPGLKSTSSAQVGGASPLSEQAISPVGTNAIVGSNKGDDSHSPPRRISVQTMHTQPPPAYSATPL